MKITPKGWAEFQHYKDRNPPWIRLHKSLLDNYEFQCLPVASRALAPMLWLLASDTREGVIDANIRKLAFRLRQSEQEIADALKPLIDNGFFVVEHDASKPLAERKQVAVPETETETETETDSVAKATDGVPPASKSPEEKAKAELWKAAVSVLEAGGCPQAQARSFMGKLVKDYGLEAVRGAIDAAVSAQPADAREYLKATCQRLKGERKDPVTVPFVKSPEQERQEREREEHERKLKDPAEQARIAEIRARARSALKVVA